MMIMKILQTFLKKKDEPRFRPSYERFYYSLHINKNNKEDVDKIEKIILELKTQNIEWCTFNSNFIEDVNKFNISVEYHFREKLMRIINVILEKENN